MITKLAGADNAADLTAWTNTIVTSIKSGSYKSQLSTWLSCVDITKAQVPNSLDSVVLDWRLPEAQTCATAWATDANAFDCSYVLNPIPAANSELSGAYYTGAAPIIQQQIAKGRFNGDGTCWTAH